MITTIPKTLKSFILPTAENLYKTCGYDITLISSYDEEFEKSLPEYIHYIPVNMKRGVSLSGFGAISKFRKIFKKQKYDAIYYMTPNASLYASIAGKQAGIKTRIYNQCGLRYVSFDGWKRLIFKLVEKITCKKSTCVKSQSPKNMQFAIDEGLCKAEKISVVGIGGTVGVDIKECQSFDHAEKRQTLREKYGIDKDAFVYGYVGRINKDKGISELITAFQALEQERDNLYLVLVGKIDHSNPIRKEDLEYAKNHPRIVFTGAVPLDEVYPHMAMFDVLTHPTYREGFGKVLQEAMGVGIPVITTDIPGPSEVIENNVSGILCEVKNADDLKDKMELLYKDEELRNSLATAGFERAKKYFDRPIMLNNILLDMNDILNKQ